MLRDKPELIALGLALAIVVTGILTWIRSESLANTFLAAISAAATAAAAIMIKEIDIGLKQLRFEALSRAYDALDRDEFKESIREICNNNSIQALRECLEGNKSRALGLVRRPSIELNKAGYLIYRGFLDHRYLAEEFGGIVIRAFACMRPLLICIRNSSEDSQDERWFMRRFALLADLIAEAFLKKNWAKYFTKLLASKESSADEKGSQLSLLALQLNAYSLCMRLNKRRKLCIDYLPAINIRDKTCSTIFRELLTELETKEHSIEDLNTVSEKLIECLRDNSAEDKSDISLIWREWLDKDLVKLVKKLYRYEPPRKREFISQVDIYRKK